MHFPVVLDEDGIVFVGVAELWIAGTLPDHSTCICKIIGAEKEERVLRQGRGIATIEANVRPKLQRVIALDISQRVEKLIDRSSSELIELRRTGTGD